MAEHQNVLADLQPESIVHDESATTDEQMWDNLEYFLKQSVPVAEDAEVKLAMHPDDPPLSPLGGLARIVRSVENFDRLLDLINSPVNGITFCQGCFALRIGANPQQCGYESHARSQCNQSPPACSFRIDKDKSSAGNAPRGDRPQCRQAGRPFFVVVSPSTAL